MGQNRGVCTVLISAITFCLGVVLAKYVPLGVKYENTLSLSDVVYVLITSFVTLFAAWYLSKKLNEDRFSKELSISDLKEIEQVVGQIIRIVQSSDEGINAKLLQLVNQLEQLLSRFDRTCQLRREQDSINLIQGHFRNLYRYATDFDENPLDVQSVVKSGTDLIVEIRNTISRINTL